MIQITYAPSQQNLAERIQGDLTDQQLDIKRPVLIVLVSADIDENQEIHETIRNAKRNGQQILLVTTDSTPIPNSISYIKALDFSTGYDGDALRTRLAELHQDYPDKSIANRRALIVALIVVGGMFVLSILAIGGGLIAFPEEEYNQEATEQALAIQNQIIGTLEYLQPRSTADAQNFPATLEAIPTLAPFLEMTATASSGDRDE